MPESKKVLIVIGYFDWFSGYQETVLARALGRMADVQVLASDRVSPIFKDEHLQRLGSPRRYPVGTRLENGVTVTRVPVRERRSMVWPMGGRSVLSGHHDLVIQMMPGQGLPLAATLARHGERRVVVYGDNSAMWAQLSPSTQKVKWWAFRATKGLLYTFVNRRAQQIYGYTPETTTRLAPFSPQPIALAPLAFDAETFKFDEGLRAAERTRRGYAAGDVVVLAAGKPDPRKRLDLLVDAFASAHSRDNRFKLLIVGTGRTTELAGLIRERGLEEVTKVEEFVPADALNAVFNAADIGVWPRQPAITIQQSMASGLFPVLPFNDWVRHLLVSDTGLYVSRQADSDELAQAIQTAAASLGDADARRGRATQNQVFSGDALARRLLSDSVLRTD